MIHLTLHQTEADFDAQKDNFVKPHVAYVVETSSVDYEPYVKDYSQEYLTFVATESGTFQFSYTINYSLDDGETWTSLASYTDSPVVQTRSKILWKATRTPSSFGVGTFSSTANFTVEGNPMSLLFGDNFKGQTSLSGKNYAFKYLFSGSTTVISIENLSLPATTLAYNCYSSMFYGCTSLTTVPSDMLPATTLADYCYASMFFSCTSLTTAPSLPATTLASRCYESMFNGCTSLTTAPSLPATTLADYCYASMFFSCTSLTTAPSLPATTLATFCYGQMFYDCTSLTTAPSLPATTLATSCYLLMFYGCTSLNSITCLATDISASNCTNNWVSAVSVSGTFTKAASMNDWTSGTSGIPNGWTVQDA